MHSEYAQALDDLRFSEEAKERMSAKLASAAHHEATRSEAARLETAHRTTSATRSTSALRTPGATHTASAPRTSGTAHTPGTTPTASKNAGRSANTTCSEAARATAHATLPKHRNAQRHTRYGIAAAVAAAALVCGLGGGAYATGALFPVMDAADAMFSGAPAPTNVVSKIGRPVGAAATSEGITITADAVIGDSSSYAVLYTIEKVDGSSFDVEPDETGYLPLTVEHLSEVVGAHGSHGSSYFFDADPTDNAIQYVEMISVDAGSAITGRTLHVSFANLRDVSSGYENAPLLSGGTWQLKFVLDYEDASVTLPPASAFEARGKTIAISKTTISPITLTVDYDVDAVPNARSAESGKMTDEDESELGAFMNLFDTPVALQMTDGTMRELSNFGGTLTQHNGTTHVTASLFFGEIIDLENVSAVCIGEEMLPLR